MRRNGLSRCHCVQDFLERNRPFALSSDRFFLRSTSPPYRPLFRSHYRALSTLRDSAFIDEHRKTIDRERPGMRMHLKAPLELADDDTSDDPALRTRSPTKRNQTGLSSCPGMAQYLKDPTVERSSFV
jgi:hypothetical protein